MNAQTDRHDINLESMFKRETRELKEDEDFSEKFIILIDKQCSSFKNTLRTQEIGKQVLSGMLKGAAAMNNKYPPPPPHVQAIK